MTKKNWYIVRGTFACSFYALPTIGISCTRDSNEIVIVWLKFYIGISWEREYDAE